MFVSVVILGMSSKGPTSISKASAPTVFTFICRNRRGTLSWEVFTNPQKTALTTANSRVYTPSESSQVVSGFQLTSGWLDRERKHVDKAT